MTSNNTFLTAEDDPTLPLIEERRQNFHLNRRLITLHLQITQVLGKKGPHSWQKGATGLGRELLAHRFRRGFQLKGM